MPKSSSRQATYKPKPLSEKVIPQALNSIEPLADSLSINQVEQAKVLKVLRKYLPFRKHLKKQNFPHGYRQQLRSSCSSQSSGEKAKCEQKQQTKMETHSSCFGKMVPLVQLERIQLNEESKNYMNMPYEVRKINECIEKLQILLTTQPQKDSIQFRTRIGYLLNSIILATGFLIEKKTYKESQIMQCQDHTQILNQELRAEIYKLQADNEVSRNQFLQIKEKEEEKQKQLSKVRSILESYQGENFQLRSQVNTLNLVIQEMNLQVQKAEKKLESKRKEFNILKEEYEKISIYSRQLQNELSEEFDCREEMERLSEQIKFQRQQIDKWKQRYFQQQTVTTKQKQKFKYY